MGKGDSILMEWYNELVRINKNKVREGDRDNGKARTKDTANEDQVRI